MNTDHYQAWKKSHHIEADDVDIADAVMKQIARRARKPGSLRPLADLLLSNLIQPKACVRICVVACGGLAGLLRMMFFAYYALFA